MSQHVRLIVPIFFDEPKCLRQCRSMLGSSYVPRHISHTEFSTEKYVVGLLMCDIVSVIVQRHYVLCLATAVTKKCKQI